MSDRHVPRVLTAMPPAKGLAEGVHALQVAEARFWSKIERGGDDECWLWISGTDPYGYGRFKFGGQYFVAHRFAWRLSFGEIPEGLCACHACDVRRCCNPAHLFLGTRADNTRDMVEKGRQARGERTGNSKLDADSVREIRGLYADGRYTQEVLGQRFGVSRRLISAIVNHERWSHI
jgi:hypothetical protein